MFRSFNDNTRRFFLSTLIMSTATMGIFFTFIGILLKDSGFLEGFVGKTLSLCTISVALSSLLSSFLINNYGYKKIIISGIILLSAGMVGVALSLNTIPIFISVVLIGMGFSMHMTSEGAFLSVHNNEKDRVRVFSYNFAIKNIGVILGSFIGGQISDLLIQPFDRITAMKIIFIFCGVLLLFPIRPINKITENTVGSEDKMNFKDYYRSYISLLKGRVLMFLLYKSTIGLGAGMVVPFFSVYLKYSLDIENSIVGIIFSIAQMGCVLGGMAVPYLVNLWGRERTVIICQLISVPFLISIAFPQGLILITISFLMRSTLMNLNNPINQNLSMEMVSEDERPILSSLFTLSGNFTRAIGIVIGGYLMENISYNTPYYFTIVLYLVGTYLFFKIFGTGKPKKTLSTA